MISNNTSMPTTDENRIQEYAVRHKKNQND